MPSQRAGKARAFAPTGITSSQGSVICPAGSCTALHYVRLWLGLCTLSVTSDKKISHLFFLIFLRGANLVTRNHAGAVWLKEAAQSPKSSFPTLRQGTAERGAAVGRAVTQPGCCCSHRSGLSARSVLCLLSGIPALKKASWVFFKD